MTDLSPFLTSSILSALPRRLANLAATTLPLQTAIQQLAAAYVNDGLGGVIIALVGVGAELFGARSRPAAA